jgi:3-dehydroquinate dehydratase-1
VIYSEIPYAGIGQQCVGVYDSIIKFKIRNEIIMRQQSELQVSVRGAVIGGPKPLICLPLVGETEEKVLQESDALTALQPDLLEWRIDAYNKVEIIEDCLALLKQMRTIIGEIPLIFTCRIDQEGGFKEISREKRLALITAAMDSGDADLFDVELCNDAAFIQTVRERAKLRSVRLILSYHNFTETPSQASICAKLSEAQTAGADICKVAVMPKDYGDVLTLLNATNKARKEMVKCPMVTMSMGPEGAVSRLAGGLFGSDITFAVGVKASAPGQIPIKELATVMDLLY